MELIIKNTEIKQDLLKAFKAIFTIILTFYLFNINAQCPSGIVILSSDEEIIAFSKSFPNCTELDSSLIIGPNQDMGKTRITDISPLSKIKSIAGDFTLTRNPWLSSIKALEAIEIVEGNVHLAIHKDMEEEVFSSKLLVVKGELRLNVSCIECKTKLLFPDLIKIGGDLSLYGYESMGHMFPSLWKVGGGIWNSTTSRAYNEEDFPNLRKVGGTLSFSVGSKEKHLFPSLRSVDRLQIKVGGKERFSVGFLEECRSLKIQNQLVHNVGFLSNLDSLEYLSIDMLNEKTVNSLSNLIHVDKIDIRNLDPELKEGFSNLKSTKEIVLSGNTKSGKFKGLTSINNIEISNNNAKFTLSELENLKQVDRLTYQYIKSDTLRDIVSFDLDNLNIHDNRQLTNINLKLSNPVTKVRISRNENLISIEDLEIPVNPSSILYIQQNKNLNNCVTPTVCNYLKEGFNQLHINNNGPECTLEKVRAGCNID